MKFTCPLFSLLLVAVICSPGFAQTANPHDVLKPLRNADVLRLHQAGMKPGQIITRIVTSQCNFDIFPPALQELKLKGLPQTVIMAMMMVPYGPPASARDALPPPPSPPQTVRVRIPAGTVVHVQNISEVSSANVAEGALINLRVSRSVLVDGMLVIDRGALARARVVKTKRARAWGRGGAFDWSLEDVVAVDGTVVPIRGSQHVKGNDPRAAVVTAAIVTGAVVFPYTPPMGLLGALKKGDEAVLDGNKGSAAIVGSHTEVLGILPLQRKVIFHSVEQLKTAEATKSGGLAPMNQSFKASSIRRND